MSLSAVPDPPGVNPAIPPHNGKPVAASKLRITGVASPVEIDDLTLEVDQIVRCYVEVRVTGVGHEVNDKTGDLERIQKGRALELEVVPWDPDDPNDHGVR